MLSYLARCDPTLEKAPDLCASLPGGPRDGVDAVPHRAPDQRFGSVGSSTPGIGAPIIDVLRAIDARGLVVAPGITAEVRTDLAQHKRYDQILCLPHDSTRFSGRGGVVDFYRGDYRALFPRRRMSKAAFTHQVSDHLPLWAEVIARGGGNSASAP